jgi:hypothetical protein
VEEQLTAEPVRASIQTSRAKRLPARHPCVRAVVASMLAVTMLFTISDVQAQQPRASEYKIKATYLFNFGKFVQWQSHDVAAQSDSFPICILGEDPFGAALDSILQGESIDGRAVIAKRVLNAEEGRSCRVLFISLSEAARVREVLMALDKAGVLTVSDIPQFSQHGGMIEFVTVGNKIRFEVNVAKTQDEGLVLSSDLLKVATTVRKFRSSED